VYGYNLLVPHLSGKYLDWLCVRDSVRSNLKVLCQGYHL
jgi:hypothetical protein